MSQRRPAGAPCWPDRSAHRRRRIARRAFWIAVVVALVLPWSGYQVRQWIGEDLSQGAGRAAVDPGAAPRAAPSDAAAPPATTVVTEATTGDVEAIGRDARAGDGEAAVARLEGVDAQVQRQVLLADRGSAVRREAARRELADMRGVRAAGWVDRMTLLLVASARGQGASMIAEACGRLAAHGDVSGLAVRVQEVADGIAGAGALMGECRPRPSAPWADRQRGPDAPWKQADAQHESAGEAETPAIAAERRRRREESLHILSESTPELPSAPGPRVDP